MTILVTNQLSKVKFVNGLFYSGLLVFWNNIKAPLAAKKANFLVWVYKGQKIS
jgi:hypothetical protein